MAKYVKRTDDTKPLEEIYTNYMYSSDEFADKIFTLHFSFTSDLKYFKG